MKILMLCLLFVIALYVVHIASVVPDAPVAPATAKPSPTLRASTSAPSTHAIYPYSITPGGVWSPEEAGLKDGYVVQLSRDMKAFVSYRHNGRVYWTRHAVVIRAGEKLVTDGKTTLRSRCGNSVSVTPQAPTEATDISTVLDTPYPIIDNAELRKFNSSLIPPTEVGPPPSLSFAPGLYPSAFFGIGGVGSFTPGPGHPGSGFPGGGTPGHGDGGGPPTPRPPATVPEPSSIILMVTGVGAFFARRK